MTRKEKVVSYRVKFFFVFFFILYCGVSRDAHNFTPKYQNYTKEKHFKYILRWTYKKVAPTNYFGDGQNAFIKYKCPEQNCYVTDDKNYFGGDLKQFDAVLFNGRHPEFWSEKYSLNKPERRWRSPHQKYVYVMSESASMFPVCTRIYNNFFNWTLTYRLDSDCPLRYFTITNMKGKEVGPKLNMRWIREMKEVDENIVKKLRNKTKAVAWFVSNCEYIKNDRNVLVHRFKEALDQFTNLNLDVYGRCGTLQCPRSNSTKCDAMLSTDYFFYLALENSSNKDYVTEKVLHALNYDTVPIVLGGANYSRFLPPGSYLDMSAQNQTNLASIIRHYIQNQSLYQQFFRWTSHYRYHFNEFFAKDICEFCRMLHDKEKFEEKTVYEDFRMWWNADYETDCRRRSFRKPNRINFERVEYRANASVS